MIVRMLGSFVLLGAMIPTSLGLTQCLEKGDYPCDLWAGTCDSPVWYIDLWERCGWHDEANSSTFQAIVGQSTADGVHSGGWHKNNCGRKYPCRVTFVSEDGEGTCEQSMPDEPLFVEVEKPGAYCPDPNNDEPGGDEPGGDEPGGDEPDEG